MPNNHRLIRDILINKICKRKLKRVKRPIPELQEWKPEDLKPIRAYLLDGQYQIEERARRLLMWSELGKTRIPTIVPGGFLHVPTKKSGPLAMHVVEEGYVIKSWRRDPGDMDNLLCKILQRTHDEIQAIALIPELPLYIQLKLLRILTSQDIENKYVKPLAEALEQISAATINAKKNITSSKTVEPQS